MKFVRRARWLQDLFVPSVTPASKYPGDLSHDVSLVADYIGGGWGIPNPEEMGFTTDSVVGAAANVTILTLAADEIFRLCAISAHVIAGTNPTYASPFLAFPGVNTAPALHPGQALDGEARGFVLSTPVIGPTMSLGGRYSGGGAATQVLGRTSDSNPSLACGSR